jgi:hypothetical protein
MAQAAVPVTNSPLVRRYRGRSPRAASSQSTASTANRTPAATANAAPRAPPASGMKAAIATSTTTPRPTAVLAVLGYRIINYWLPLIPGAVAYLRLRLRPGADAKRKVRDGAG